jgi:hypothetical protein
VPADVEPTVLQRVVEAGVLVPRYGAVTGWGALAWLGGRWSTGLRSDGVTPRPVPVAASRHRIRPQAGIALCEERFDPKESSIVDGIWVTSAVRSVCFEMRHAPGVEAAVEVLDMAAYDDLVTLDEVGAWMAAHPSWTGIGQGRDAVPLGEENAWSPMEVFARIVWEVDAARPRPLANCPIFDRAGRHVATPDLVDPVAGVVAEYDGRLHLESSRRREDRDREERYATHGLECVVVMQGDLRDRGHVAHRLRAAYARAARHPAERSWTTTKPAWWVDTSTVAARRALDDDAREHWLRYRRAG